jgi:hypothetical protein
MQSDPSDCGDNSSDSEMDSVQFVVFHRNGLPDSISYTIFNTHGPTSLTTNSLIPSDTFYQKNDKDSIIFPISIHYSNPYNHGSVGTPCWPSYTVSFNWTGIARISTSTAGVALQENSLPPVLFPNPTNTLLKIRGKPTEAKVIDNLGRVITSQAFDISNNDGFTTLDVSSLQSGCYMLLLNDGQKKNFARFIKY